MATITDPITGGKAYTLYVADDNSVIRLTSLYLGDPQTNSPATVEFRVAEQVQSVKTALGLS